MYENFKIGGKQREGADNQGKGSISKERDQREEVGRIWLGLAIFLNATETEKKNGNEK